MMSRARGFVFTINNYSDGDKVGVDLLMASAEYGVVGKERGEQEETPHLQGYVYFKTLKSFKFLKECIPRAHIEAAKGNAEQNFKYCSKQGNFEEFGVRPRQGKRTDLDEVMDVLKETSKMKEAVSVARSYQSVRMAELWLKYNEEPRTWKPEVYWYYGPTGAGKSVAAKAWLGPERYTCLQTIKFWEGYDGHESVLIDDFRKDFCKFHDLLRLLDYDEFRVEVKGSSRQLRARKIAITCPYHPRLIYETREDVGQLIRRIDKIFSVRDGVCTEDVTL